MLNYSPSMAVFRLLGKRKVPEEVSEMHNPACQWAAAEGKVQDSILCLHTSPQHWLLGFFI